LLDFHRFFVIRVLEIHSSCFQFFQMPLQDVLLPATGNLSRRFGDGSIPEESIALATAVSPGFPGPCGPISALALALQLLSSEPHRIRR